MSYFILLNWTPSRIVWCELLAHVASLIIFFHCYHEWNNNMADPVLNEQQLELSVLFEGDIKSVTADLSCGCTLVHTELTPLVYIGKCMSSAFEVSTKIAAWFS